MAVSSLQESSQYDLNGLVYSGAATNDYFDDERAHNCAIQLIGWYIAQLVSALAAAKHAEHAAALRILVTEAS